jgi:hypothetical protein
VTEYNRQFDAQRKKQNSGGRRSEELSCVTCTVHCSPDFVMVYDLPAVGTYASEENADRFLLESVTYLLTYLIHGAESFLRI